jgi:hypothetical protein
MVYAKIFLSNHQQKPVLAEIIGFKTAKKNNTFNSSSKIIFKHFFFWLVLDYFYLTQRAKNTKCTKNLNHQ